MARKNAITTGVAAQARLTSATNNSPDPLASRWLQNNMLEHMSRVPDFPLSRVEAVGLADGEMRFYPVVQSRRLKNGVARPSLPRIVDAIGWWVKAAEILYRFCPQSAKPKFARLTPLEDGLLSSIPWAFRTRHDPEWLGMVRLVHEYLAFRMEVCDLAKSLSQQLRCDIDISAILSACD